MSVSLTKWFCLTLIIVWYLSRVIKLTELIVEFLLKGILFSLLYYRLTLFVHVCVFQSSAVLCCIMNFLSSNDVNFLIPLPLFYNAVLHILTGFFTFILFPLSLVQQFYFLYLFYLIRKYVLVLQAQINERNSNDSKEIDH